MRRLISIVFVLIVACIAVSAQSQVDSALFASARSALPPDLSTNTIMKALDGGLWNSNRTALAISINRSPKPSLIYVFLRQTNGLFLASNVSGVEGGNFGVLGVSGRSGYDRFETTPVEWLHRDDGRFQVVMRTRAWKAGRRYTVSEKLLIAANGTPLYR